MISLDKNYRTKDGKEVRIYAIDGGGDFPVHGAVYVNCSWISETWKFWDDDLIEVVMIPEYWVVFSETGKPHYVTKVAPTYDLPEGQFEIHHPAQEKPNETD